MPVVKRKKNQQLPSLPDYPLNRRKDIGIPTLPINFKLYHILYFINKMCIVPHTLHPTTRITKLSGIGVQKASNAMLSLTSPNVLCTIILRSFTHASPYRQLETCYPVSLSGKQAQEKKAEADRFQYSTPHMNNNNNKNITTSLDRTLKKNSKNKKSLNEAKLLNSSVYIYIPTPHPSLPPLTIFW